MKQIACMLVTLFLFGSVLADDSEGAAVLPMPNGDVEIVNIGAGYAAPRTIVELNTNADCRVVCQVCCLDNVDALPDSEEEIALKDKFVNLALKIYLQNACQNLSPEELVSEYKSKRVCECLFGFPQWLSEYIRASGSEGGIDLTVIAVSMRAVGEFSERVSE